MTDRQIFEGLRETTGPANGGSDERIGFAEAEKKFFGVLREEARPSLKIFCLAQSAGLNGDGRADSIAIALCAAEPEGNGGADFGHDVVENAELRGVPIFQDEFEPAVVIEVGERKRAAVVEKIQAGDAGDF